ncbi:hypothetical protein CKM354_001173900 [Cercospora kikuchii]|uniref:Uncharacterized protein n=1 Tax=Cercospora kikuchii TaxID=84275 RepID=A0A9P3FL56_9PEZI|nr:uncharacterized protein CKM354_001173900 [Cercospora kikuchii]GIZ48689.1 hypothetical protein CKM354_001173900 [Cercospora kikuchii]
MKSFVVALAYIALAFAAPIIIEPQGQASSPNAVSSRDEAVKSSFDIAHKNRQARSIAVNRREDDALAGIVSPRDGTTEFDADAFYKDRRNDAALEARDGTTEFDADAMYKGRRDDDAVAGIVVTVRDGTTEFDADAFYKD